MNNAAAALTADYTIRTSIHTGVTFHVAEEVRATITAFNYVGGAVVGIFAQVPSYDEANAGIWYMAAEQATALPLRGPYVDVTSTPRKITRDEFDALTGIDQLRAEYGWAA